MKTLAIGRNFIAKNIWGVVAAVALVIGVSMPGSLASHRVAGVQLGQTARSVQVQPAAFHLDAVQAPASVVPFAVGGSAVDLYSVDRGTLHGVLLHGLQLRSVQFTQTNGVPDPSLAITNANQAWTSVSYIKMSILVFAIVMGIVMKIRGR